MEHISCFRRLTDLNIFQNFSTLSRGRGLSTAEQCQILMRLKQLTHLHRGAFLCEVLEYINTKPNWKNTKLKLQDFWSSEDYFFHNEYQMSLVRQFCPEINKAYFMYKQECCGSLFVLTNFQYLTGNMFSLLSVNNTIKNILIWNSPTIYMIRAGW